jgi:hypothetical protein
MIMGTNLHAQPYRVNLLGEPSPAFINDIWIVTGSADATAINDWRMV